jgi:hypothetical protein
MSAEPQPRPIGTIEEHRISFDSSTGEVCPNCSVVRRDVEALETDLRIKRRKITELQADKDRQAENSDYWEPARELFHHWQGVCDKRRSPWSHDRFWKIEPFLRKKHISDELLRRAIDGAAYQAWCYERSNGSFALSNGWDKIFDSTSSVEEFANRAPRGWSMAYSIEMESWPSRKPGPEHDREWFGIRPPQGWQPPAQETKTGQVTLVGVSEG